MKTKKVSKKKDGAAPPTANGKSPQSVATGCNGEFFTDMLRGMISEALRQGFTKEGFCKEVGISVQRVNVLLKGGVSPHGYTLVRGADILGKRIEEFIPRFGGKEPDKTHPNGITGDLPRVHGTGRTTHFDAPIELESLGFTLFKQKHGICFYRAGNADKYIQININYGSGGVMASALLNDRTNGKNFLFYFFERIMVESISKLCDIIRLFPDVLSHLSQTTANSKPCYIG